MDDFSFWSMGLGKARKSTGEAIGESGGASALDVARHAINRDGDHPDTLQAGRF
ncbi:MAG: hypothetical protein IPM03_14510 [Sulfuritalea sp.]|nr:hypothetical protein [Sulfuritalea sp.]